MAIGLTIQHIKNWQSYLDKFWELHPSVKSMGAFRDLYKNDKTQDKRSSSRKAWYCVLYTHPESDFYNGTHEDKLNDLGPDLFSNNLSSSKYQKYHDDLEPCMTTCKKYIYTKSHKHLAVLHDKLSQKAQLYATTPYTIQNSKVLDDMIKADKTLMQTIQECEDIVKQSARDGSIKGGAELSMMEDQDFFD